VCERAVVEDMMNRDWVLHHLAEASEELNRTIDEIHRAGDYDDAEFGVAIAHIYHHLNTTWNSRDATDERVRKVSDADFKSWSAFPKDVLIFR
jgi:hypothetical protein